MKYKYTGKGMIHGVPARDLSEDEWNALTEQARETGIKFGIYVVAESGKKEVKHE